MAKPQGLTAEPQASLIRQPHLRPYVSLIAVFLAWKAILLAVALASPGPGYDTSTEILFRKGHPPDVPGPAWFTAPAQWIGATWFTAPTERLAKRLVRWDAIYFVEIGSRGRLYEQEWAWGWGWTELLRWLGARTYRNPWTSIYSPVYILNTHSNDVNQTSTSRNTPTST
jgi:GPI mannosyltransferase 2